MRSSDSSRIAWAWAWGLSLEASSGGLPSARLATALGSGGLPSSDSGSFRLRPLPSGAIQRDYPTMDVVWHQVRSRNDFADGMARLLEGTYSSDAAMFCSVT